MAASTGKPMPDWVREAVAQLPPLVPEGVFASLLSVDERTSRRWRAAGRIRGIKTTEGGSGRILYPRAEVARFLADLGGAA